MKKLKTVLILATVILSAKVLTGQSTEKSSVIDINLPAQKTIDGNAIRLGQICVISGDEVIAKKAGEISLANFSTAGQKITIDRNTIISRLAANGITRISMSGAERTVVGRGEKVIGGKEFVEQAINLLKKNSAYSGAGQLRALRTPEDLLIGKESRQIKLVPRLLASSTSRLARLEFAVFADEKEVGKREVLLQVVKEENDRSLTVAALNDSALMVADLTPGIKPGAFGAKTAELNNGDKKIVVNRNQNVLIKVEKGGLEVQASGKALGQGRAGEYIKVQNTNSNRIITAKIKEDGSVEPIF